MPGSQFNPMPNDRPGELERRVRDLERLVQEMAAARTLENASITAAAGLGIRTSDFDGTSFANPGTHGNYFGGDGAVLNALYLRPGSISNAVLANPVRGDSAYAYATNFALTTTGTTPLVSQSWYTPTGFTTANVLIAGRVFAYNSTASLDYLFARSRVYVPSSGQTGYGTGLPLAVSASGGSGLNSSPISIKVANLTDGQEIRLEIQGWTNTAGWAANAGNTADVAGQIIWTR
jgi:hypothetical protein